MCSADMKNKHVGCLPKSLASLHSERMPPSRPLRLLHGHGNTELPASAAPATGMEIRKEGSARQICKISLGRPADTSGQEEKLQSLKTELAAWRWVEPASASVYLGRPSH
jgi:hypothetical protein